MGRPRRKKQNKVVEELDQINVIDLEVDTTCNICYAEFIDSDDLRIHVEQVHVTDSSRNRFCKFCTSLYTDLESYARHIKDSHITCLKSCRYCTRAYVDEKLLGEHEALHFNLVKKSVYACSQCRKQFSNTTELEEHEFKVHADCDNGIFLQECLPYLSSMINMKAITFLQSLNGDILFKCASCKTISSDLAEHIQHLNENGCHSLVCDRCGNVYGCKKSLINHFQRNKCKSTHSKTNNLKKCTNCHMSFNNYMFKKHIKNCAVIQCRRCNISFKSSQELSKHQNNEHPSTISLQKCKYCQKEFVGILGVKKHIERSHKHELHLYKYSCKSCETIFKHPKYLFAHFYSKHKDLEPFTCHICNIKFKMRKKFTLHIKLVHKSEGCVNFDANFNVYFTDQSLESVSVDSLNTSNDKCGEDDADVKENIQFVSDEDSNLSNPETEVNGVHLNDESNSKHSALQRIRTTHEKRKNLMKNNLSSGNSNKVMNTERKIVKRKLRNKSNKKSKISARKFTCKLCMENCGSLHNYHRHLVLHFKKSLKKCVKCSITFKSETELNDHITSKHSSSKLTETLKQLLQRKRNNVEGSSHTSVKTLNRKELFQNTIKKIPDDIENVAVTITQISDVTPVQKYIENFTPEISDNLQVLNPITIKPVVTSDSSRPSIIKMTKFKPVNDTDLISKPKLAMPVKFKNDYNKHKHKVTYKIVNRPIDKQIESFIISESTANLNFDNVQSEVFDSNDYYEEEVAHEENDYSIPEVAREVSLEGTDESAKTITHTIKIPEIPEEMKNVKIAHLVPNAPFYKLLSLTDIVEQPKDPSTSNVTTLPSGMKLVQVNPLAHLLGDKTDILKPKKKYYKPKISDYASNIVKAFQQLERPTVKQRKNSRSNE